MPIHSDDDVRFHRGRPTTTSDEYALGWGDWEPSGAGWRRVRPAPPVPRGPCPFPGCGGR
jgi:hypothetical protein